MSGARRRLANHDKERQANGRETYSSESSQRRRDDAEERWVVACNRLQVRPMSRDIPVEAKGVPPRHIVVLSLFSLEIPRIRMEALRTNT